MDIEEVIKRVANALREADGEVVAQIHNELCDDDVVGYLGDGLFEIIELK